MKRAVIFIAAASLGLCGLKSAQTSPGLEIHLDSNAHTITQNVHCDGDQVTSLETFVDGVYLTTVYLPPPAPTGLRIIQ